MITWKYTDQSRRVVISDDGRQSCLASALPEDTLIAEPDPPSPAELRAACVTAAQARLDAFAVTLGYDDLKSATTYVGDDNPKYDREARALRSWRSQTWTAIEDIARRQAAGKVTITSVEGFLALLPPTPDITTDKPLA